MALVQKEIKKVTIRPNGQEKQIRPVIPPELCFTANTANSTVKLTKTGSPTAVTLETSTDGINWSTYTFGSTITLSNIGDKVYWRNTSETTTSFSTSSSTYYKFVMTGSINASGDVTSLVNKNFTTTLIGNYCLYQLFHNSSSNTVLKTAPELPATTLTKYCYTGMFYNCAGLTIAPSLPATTVTQSCYGSMFAECTNLETLPNLPATTLAYNCYDTMFYNCSKIKLSTTQTGEYQTPYRIPTTGTGTPVNNWNISMLMGTGGTFTSNPNTNTTYYTSNTLV